MSFWESKQTVIIMDPHRSTGESRLSIPHTQRIMKRGIWDASTLDCLQTVYIAKKTRDLQTGHTVVVPSIEKSTQLRF